MIPHGSSKQNLLFWILLFENSYDDEKKSTSCVKKENIENPYTGL